MEIQIYKSVSRFLLSESETRRIVFRTLSKIKRTKVSLSVGFIGDKRMRSINRDYRGKDTTTDVLAFAAQEGVSFLKNSELGDIFISIPKIITQAKRFKVSAKEECARMLIHGVLHLAGFDHIKKKDAEIMLPLQEALVKKCL